VHGAVSPLDIDKKERDSMFGILNGLGVTRERSIAAAVAGSHHTLGQGHKENRSLERNPSVLSRKELIK